MNYRPINSRTFYMTIKILMTLLLLIANLSLAMDESPHECPTDFSQARWLKGQASYECPECDHLLIKGFSYEQIGDIFNEAANEHSKCVAKDETSTSFLCALMVTSLEINVIATLKANPYLAKAMVFVNDFYDKNDNV